MGIIIEFFIETVFRGLIVHFFGLYPRYYFFKLIGKEKNIKYLAGEKKLYSSTDIIQQHVFNVVIGLIMFAITCLFIAYLVF